MFNRFGMLALVVLAVVTACSESDEITAPTTESSEPVEANEPVEASAASVEAFCTECASVQVEQPESYVGSAEHVADIDRLLGVAPDAVAADVATFSGSVSSGAIDVDADPESNVTANWPDDVQDAIASTQAFAADNC